MKIIDIVESNRDVAIMQPDTPITVFHGTDVTQALEFCTNGIDARQRQHRLYPHWDRGEYVSRGLFVTTTLKVAMSFGHVVLKFRVLAKHLHFQYPSPTSQRDADRASQPYYPKSFRPGTSFNLLAVAKEKQALFRGLVSPRAIEKVYLVSYDAEGNRKPGRYDEYQAAMTREEFLRVFADKASRPHKLRAEPQQLTMTPDELVGTLVKQYGGDQSIDDATAWIDGIMRDAIDPASHPTYQSQISGLMNFPGGSALPYSVAKRLLPKFLARYNLSAAPNVQERLKKGPHFG
jgi:hypothetical protein